MDEGRLHRNSFIIDSLLVTPWSSSKSLFGSIGPSDEFIRFTIDFRLLDDFPVIAQLGWNCIPGFTFYPPQVFCQFAATQRSLMLSPRTIRGFSPPSEAMLFFRLGEHPGYVPVRAEHQAYSIIL